LVGSEGEECANSKEGKSSKGKNKTRGGGGEAELTEENLELRSAPSNEKKNKHARTRWGGRGGEMVGGGLQKSARKKRAAKSKPTRKKMRKGRISAEGERNGKK